MGRVKLMGKGTGMSPGVNGVDSRRKMNLGFLKEKMKD
jgi:hypothetical protein